MFSKSIIYNFIKIGIQTWLKSICTSIDIRSLKLIVNKKCFGKLDEVYLEAKNIIFQGLYINKLSIKIYDCNFKFNYRNHLIYSEDLILNSLLTFDNRSLENTFFSKECENLRIKIQKALTDGKTVSNLIINNDLITFSYDMNKLNKEVILLINLKENLILLEDINNKKKICLPLDKNIKFNSFNIKNELINIDLSSKVIFDN